MPDHMGQFSTSSSRMTLSPKTTTSNSLFWIRRFRMFRLGLLRALMSRAQTPMTPRGAGFCSSLSRLWTRSLLGLWELVAVLPLKRRLALLRSLAGCGRAVAAAAASGRGGGGMLLRLMRSPREWGWWGTSRGARWWPAPWLPVVTVTLDTPVSDDDACGPPSPIPSPGPVPDAIAPIPGGATTSRPNGSLAGVPGAERAETTIPCSWMCGPAVGRPRRSASVLGGADGVFRWTG